MSWLEQTHYAKKRDFFNVTVLHPQSLDEVFETMLSAGFVNLLEYEPYWSMIDGFRAKFNESKYDFHGYFFANEVVDNLLYWVWNNTYRNVPGTEKERSKNADRVKNEYYKLMKEKFL